MAEGKFQTSRCIFENKIWQNIVEFRLFFFVYGNAVWKPDGVKKGEVTIGRGKYLRSLRNLQKDLEFIENHAVKQYSLSTIQRAIQSLVKNKRLIIKSTELGTLFEIVNYEAYQGFDGLQNRQLDTTNEQMENTDRTDGEQIQNNKKKDKKDKNVNKTLYSEFVQMTAEEYQKLVSKYGDKKTALMIEELDRFIPQKKGKPYSDHYRACQATWVLENVSKKIKLLLKQGPDIGRKADKQDKYKDIYYI